MNKKLSHLFMLLTVTASLISACASGNPFAENDKVNVQLSWFHSVEYAGFYAALENGYYAEENIDVTLTGGGPTVDALNEVNSGKAQFGISTGDSLIIARTKQQNLLAVATLFRNTPLVVMSLDDGNIEKPEDLSGKTVGVIAPDLSTTWDIQFLALLQRMDIDRESITFSAIEDYHGTNEITSGKVDALSGMFATNEPVLAGMEGSQINLIYYKDYGVDVYPNALFVTEEFATANADLVTRFVRATLRGYQFAIEHPEETAAFALKYDETLDLAFQQEVMKAQIPFIDTGDAPIGSMDEDVWNTTQEILLDFGLISEPIDISTVYTNNFINPNN
ncbi:MAG: ABC transporter substrate-binding protein [Anaerolineales bacterium]|nr:ABC transporter substrate-binding protein [Anaerolineales bacterium]